MPERGEFAKQQKKKRLGIPTIDNQQKVCWTADSTGKNSDESTKWFLTIIIIVKNHFAEISMKSHKVNMSHL